MTDVSKLEGAELDAAVAFAMGMKIVTKQRTVGLRTWAAHPVTGFVGYIGGEHVPAFSPSTLWSIGGPIIQREGIALDCWPGRELAYRWRAAIAATTVNACEYGPTPLIAAMRAFCAARSGTGG